MAFAVLGLAATVLTSEATFAWWAYRLGFAAGKKAAERAAAEAEGQARIDDLERQLAETRKQLAALQPPPSA